jgi:hypothetical protein
MDPLTLLFRLPLLPLRGLIRLAEIIDEQAERELYNPASVQRQLQDAEDALESGEISEEEAARLEADAAHRLVHGAPAAAAAGAEGS